MNQKDLPRFNNEQEESQFWQETDSTPYINWNAAKPVVFSKLKPSTKSISIRLPVSLIENVKLLANKRDVPYQSFIKVLLEDAVSKELNKN